MRFSAVVALSAAALASSAVAYPASAHSSYELSSRETVDDSLYARAPTKKTSKSAQAATNGANLKKNLPNEIKANIGKQGLDGSKAAADRAKTLGTSQKDIQKGYQPKLNHEIKSGNIPGASWGLQATSDNNRRLRRDVDIEEIVDLLTRSLEDDEELFARDFDNEGEFFTRGFDEDDELFARAKTSKSAQAATNGANLKKNLPNEIKANIGKQGLDGSKAAADRAKTLGTSQKDIQKGYHPKLNQEIKSGNIPGASWGLQATLDHNRKLRRDVEDIVDLLTRSLEEDEELFARDFDDEELFARAKKTSKSAQAATNAAKLRKNLPNEIKAEIGKQGLDGSKAAADRAKTMGTSQKDIQKGYQSKLNQEITGGRIPGASWGLQATLDHNRQL